MATNIQKQHATSSAAGTTSRAKSGGVAQTGQERIEFWKSLLRIEASVSVALASKDLPVDRILNLAPGMMLQFDKSCDTPLTLEVDDQKLAQGEVVKVGDKFGLRITEVLSCEERWVSLPTNPGTGSHS